MFVYGKRFPSLTNKDIISLLQRFGSKFEQPDAELGYGIPDVYKAYKQERKYAAESKITYRVRKRLYLC